LVEIHAQLVSFTVEEEVFPGDLVLQVPGRATEHAAKGRLDACGDLVMGTT
jgi:hypothetical protein